MRDYFVTQEPMDSSSLEKTLNHAECGGVVIFVGKVRSHHHGKSVTSLTYEAYIPLAENVFKELAQVAKAKFNVQYIRIAHRVGHLQIGDTAVWIGVEATHRAEAFQACHYLIDHLKKEAPIWKKETYQDGSFVWVQGCDE